MFFVYTPNIFILYTNRVCVVWCSRLVFCKCPVQILGRMPDILISFKPFLSSSIQLPQWYLNKATTSSYQILPNLSFIQLFNAVYSEILRMSQNELQTTKCISTQFGFNSSNQTGNAHLINSRIFLLNLYI